MGVRRLTTEEFVVRARAVHGDVYDYSASKYQTARRKVAIECPAHGTFVQTPAHHLSGTGCPQCAGNVKLTTGEFVARACALHGETYVYDRVDYRGLQADVSISCREHGAFSQTPGNHLAGQGCPACGEVKRRLSKRVGRDRFIARAAEVHGQAYGYDAVVYTTNRDPVQIQCPQHGYFRQAPSHHLDGTGCPECGRARTARARRSDTDAFGRKAREVHGSRYDYSQVHYLDNSTDVEIVCPDHGPFLQTPSNHLGGRGCGECGRIRGASTQRRDTATFVARARRKHGDRYDYCEVDYEDSRTPVVIACPDHGPFEQAPVKHLWGAGCPSCAGSQKLDTAAFVARATVKHGETYDYAEVNYVNNRTQVVISCRIHGRFAQAPGNHLRGKGCPTCGRAIVESARRSDTETFTARARALHGGRYDYSEVAYLNNSTHVTILCPEHGAFSQVAANHLAGHGCRACTAHGFDPSQPGRLYYVKVNADDGRRFWKLGITNKSVAERFEAQAVSYTILREKIFPNGQDAAAAERELLRTFSYALVPSDTQSPFRQTGVSELFAEDVLSPFWPEDEAPASGRDLEPTRGQLSLL